MLSGFPRPFRSCSWSDWWQSLCERLVGSQRKCKFDREKVTFLLLSSCFSYYSACSWHGSPCLLHSTPHVVFWGGGWGELISATVWAQDGSEAGEGAWDAERDLMRMPGCGCMYLFVCVLSLTKSRTPLSPVLGRTLAHKVTRFFLPSLPFLPWRIA